MKHSSLLNIEINLEGDIVVARQRARQIASLLGFAQLDQTRIATATSEIARSAFHNAGGGRLEFLLEFGMAPALVIVVRERGQGLNNLKSILELESAPPRGDVQQFRAAQRMMDRFGTEASSGGNAKFVMAKTLPQRTFPFTSAELARISAELVRSAPRGLLEELQQQNQELLRALQELRDRQTEIAEMHSRELEETNRGVVAMYTQLDESSKALQRLSELKSRFLSEMSHELRSPLNSIRSLTGFLLARTDGELSAEQEKQVRFIQQAADGLSTIVDDLLDLAKVEAGKAAIRTSTFALSAVFEGLQGTILPMISREAVSLVFEAPVGIRAMQTDEGKVAQILRNYLTNAVKFTERGEIRVSAKSGPEDVVIFSVKDTGIGIAPENLSRVFEEFGQIENDLQKRVKGTGLGLPLTKKLAELLGGSVSVRSQPGVGSNFYAVIPRIFRDTSQGDPAPRLRWALDPAREPVLVVDQDPAAVSLYEKHAEGLYYQFVQVTTTEDAKSALGDFRPRAVILEMELAEQEGESLLGHIKSRHNIVDMPVLTVGKTDRSASARALGALAFGLKPVTKEWLLRMLGSLEASHAIETALIIDDRERDRYLIKESLAAIGQFEIIEAERGDDAFVRLRGLRPDVIFLDLNLPDMNGFEILEKLKSDARLKDIPVIVNTSRLLEESERGRLAERAVAILAKGCESPEESIAQIRYSLRKAGLRVPAGEWSE